MTRPSTTAGLFEEAPSQAAKAYWILAERIMRLDLPPRAVLNDRDLSGEIGIGRTPIREALQRLSAEGLVIHFPNRGMVVSEITAAGTADIYEFRSLIDSEAARLAAMRRTDEEADNLVTLGEALRDGASGEDVDHYIRTDRSLYRALGQASRNEFIAETISRIFNLHIRLWFFISLKENNWNRLAKLHSEMAADMTDAVARKDPDAAAIAVKSYISDRQKDVRRLI